MKKFDTLEDAIKHEKKVNPDYFKGTVTTSEDSIEINLSQFYRDLFKAIRTDQRQLRIKIYFVATGGVVAEYFFVFMCVGNLNIY